MRHLDEARETAVAALTALVSTDQRIQRMVLIDDLFGLLRVVVWVSAADSDSVRTSINRLLHDEGNLGPYWTGDVWVSSNASAADTVVYDAAWNTAQVVPGTETLRIADRHRSRVSWFAEPVDSPWPVPEAAAKDAPPIVVFYSFKGGVGRSTSVAAFALQRARQGERVVVVDFDLDAPGVGSLLAADSAGTTAAWGVIDYLLERPHGPVDLADYYIGFPCMHIALPLVSIWFLRKWPRIVIVLAACALFLVASIILLEWHYLIDLFAGVLVAISAVVGEWKFKHS